MRAFFYGQLSGMVEPIGGVVGAGLVGWMRPLLPYALAFAAGAMVWVVCDDLVVEIKGGEEEDATVAAGKEGGGGKKKADWGMLGLMLGFVVMMSLDISLG